LKEEIVNGIIINPEQKINKLAGEKLIWIVKIVIMQYLKNI
jgi:hypothetical protein